MIERSTQNPGCICDLANGYAAISVFLEETGSYREYLLSPAKHIIGDKMLS